MTRIRNASKDTLFGKADSKLSDMASQLRQINKSEDECYEDIDAYYAPSECRTLVRKSHHRLRRTMYTEYEMTEDEFMDAVEARTSAKWLHWHSGFIY